MLCMIYLSPLSRPEADMMLSHYIGNLRGTRLTTLL